MWSARPRRFCRWSHWKQPRAEERIIAALPLLLAVKTLLPCAVPSAHFPKGHKPCHDPLPHESLQALNVGHKKHPRPTTLKTYLDKGVNT
jgi:hypothetical protein